MFVCCRYGNCPINKLQSGVITPSNSDKIKLEIKKEENDNQNVMNNRELIYNYFKKISNDFIGKECELIFSNNKFPLSLKMEGESGNPGDGDRKTLVAAFDFTLIEYNSFKNIEMPMFVIHDKMEEVPICELEKIFKYCRKNNIQYILPILSDRISSIKLENNEIILTLSKNDKLFKI